METTTETAEPQTQDAPPAKEPSALDERIERIKTKMWVPYPEANEVFKIMRRLQDAPNENRPENLAVIGDPSFGKSYLLKRYVLRNQSSYDPAQRDPTIDIVHIDMPETPEPGAMLREILQKIGAGRTIRESIDEMRRRICVLAEAMKVRLFIIDEFHNAFRTGTNRQHHLLLNIVRTLTTLTNRPLVVAGTEEVDHFLEFDQQLDERFIRRRLKKWDDTATAQRLLKGFEQEIQLQNSADLASPEMTTHVINLTNGKMGRIARLLILAAEDAIRKGTETIDKDLLSVMATQLSGRSSEMD